MALIKPSSFQTGWKSMDADVALHPQGKQGQHCWRRNVLLRSFTSANSALCWNQICCLCSCFSASPSLFRLLFLLSKVSFFSRFVHLNWTSQMDIMERRTEHFWKKVMIFDLKSRTNTSLPPVLFQKQGPAPRKVGGRALSKVKCLNLASLRVFH